MVTQKDISVVCGVSIAAVSRALSGHGDISVMTRKRIIDAAERMGYVKAGDRSKKRHTYLVGILFTEKEMDSFHSDIIVEIRASLMEFGYDLVIINPPEKENGTAERPGYMSRARYLGLDGILVFSEIRQEDFCLSPEQKELRELVFGEIPVVTVDCSFGSRSSVRPAYEEGIRNLFGHVYNHGHRRIAFLAGKRMANHNILEKEIRSIASEKDLKMILEMLRIYEIQNEQQAAERTEEILCRGKWIPPTCIIFGDEILSKGGMRAITSNQLRIPEDISAVSLTFQKDSDPAERSLTSWEMSPRRVAKKAVEMMIREIRLPGVYTGEERLVGGALVERGSVGKL